MLGQDLVVVTSGPEADTNQRSCHRARRSARRGATVIGTATTDDGAAASPATSGRRHRRDRHPARRRRCRRVDAALADVDARFGAIAILVNNAGITRDNLLLRMKDDEWDAIMATNLSPAYRLAKARAARA